MSGNATEVRPQGDAAQSWPPSVQQPARARDADPSWQKQPTRPTQDTVETGQELESQVNQFRANF